MEASYPLLFSVRKLTVDAQALGPGPVSTVPCISMAFSSVTALNISILYRDIYNDV